jgi:hypothetical protein
MYLTGKGRRATYAEAKPATDEILSAYSRRPDVKEVVDGVNSYLQNIVVYDFLLARAAADSARWKSQRNMSPMRGPTAALAPIVLKA